MHGKSSGKDRLLVNGYMYMVRKKPGVEKGLESSSPFILPSQYLLLAIVETHVTHRICQRME
jgi:hypothetical protein